MAVTPAAVQLADYTGFLIRRAQQLHAAVWQREASAEFTSVQFGALNLVHANPGIDQRTLGEHLKLDRSTIADVCARLERRGLIMRDRDSADQRRNVLSLTEQGQAVLVDLVPRADRVHEVLIGRLSQPDRAELHRLLILLLARG
ncbi:MarR family winged helix-turn-helix transcriptional regulator [Glaciibacter superstes]|uniref:MarR family winged helix-turn-helix transcriptional regulator n=1 Tax=Glaciibacter superstes TaxID=501023 RepID=UPI0003B6D781|nr:MarR family transcriptional regulator [Glaciibacter superstes]